MSTNEFDYNGSKLSVYLMCLKYEIKASLKNIAKRLLKENRKDVRKVKHRYSVLNAKQIVIDENLALTDCKQPSWFYTAFERNDSDPLTNYSLRYIEEKVDKNAAVLVTGCGTGIMVFHLADSGFGNIEGIDLLDKCINIANKIKDRFNYSGVTFNVDDCLKPTLSGKYDLITALHWVFSAWMGNYGNDTSENPFDPGVREELLTELLRNYSGQLNNGGLMIIELTDAVADYREAYDHPLGLESRNIYPVRQTPEQVSKCASAVGLDVVEKKLCVSYGHQPRTTYILKKRLFADPSLQGGSETPMRPESSVEG